MTRKLDVASRQNITSASQSPAVNSLACTTVAAPIATSDHGCMKAPNPTAAHGDMRSSHPIQVGGLRGRPRLRRRRMPTQISRMPSSALTTRTAVEGAVCGRGGLPPVAESTAATTATRQAVQPRMNASPFQMPPLAARRRMNATSVSGSSVIASPMITKSSTTR